MSMGVAWHVFTAVQGATAANKTCSGTIETPAASSRSDTLQGALVSSSRVVILILRCDRQEAHLL